MQRFKPQLRLPAHLITAVIVLLAASACGGKIPPTHYYKLNIPPPPMAGQGTGAKTAVVMPFLGSKMLTQDRIIYRPNSEEVGFYEYHRWAEDPRTTITQSLLDHLRGKNTFDQVVLFDGRTTADYMIRGRIERLEEVDEGTNVKVALRISASVLSVDKREPLWDGTQEETLTVDVRDVRTVVSKMSDAASTGVAKLAAEIDTFIRSHQRATAPNGTRAVNAGN